MIIKKVSKIDKNIYSNRNLFFGKKIFIFAVLIFTPL